MPQNPARLAASTLIAITLVIHPEIRADDILHQFEGDRLPYDPSAGWIIANACEPPCSEAVEDGHFVLRWPVAGDLAYYHLWIAQPPEPPPRTLWVEWRFRSNHPLPYTSYTCDASFVVHYQITEIDLELYGDAVLPLSGDVVMPLDLYRFHTFRFESPDGVGYRIFVDGNMFLLGGGVTSNGYHFLQFGGRGGCIDDQIPDMINEWDFIRYGTISYGEKIVAANPPAGFLRPEDFPALDRFTVRFDQPNYVYVDEIGVESFDADGNRQEATGNSGPPVVVATRRLDNGPPDVVEIVLDKPIPLDARTVFTFDDGTIRQTVAYTYVQGDANADGRFDLRDATELQNCFLDETVAGHCWAFDFDADNRVSLKDDAAFHPLLAGPQ